MANDATQKPAAGRETYDDRPFHMDDLPPEVRAPLAPFAGEEPPAPEWFKWAIAQEPERQFVASHGIDLEALSWGERGRPGCCWRTAIRRTPSGGASSRRSWPRTTE
jgi:hypothetical protein